MNTKLCSVCKKEKPYKRFSKSGNGLSCKCKDCVKEAYNRNKDYFSKWHKEKRLLNLEETHKRDREYREKHRDQIRLNNKRWYSKPEVKKRESERAKEYNIINKDRNSRRVHDRRITDRGAVLKREREYRASHKEQIKGYAKKYRESHREKLREQSKIYGKNNRDKTNDREKRRLLLDPVFRVRKRASKLANYALKANGGNKAGKSFFSCVDYTPKELKEHLESQFTKSMNWENYGSYWQIHHVRPQMSFSFTSMDDIEFKECWALDNLMPLEKTENHKLGVAFCAGIQRGIEPCQKDFYKVNNSLLPWVLEEVTRQAIIKVVRRKKGV